MSPETQTATKVSSSLSLDHLIALNDEIAALVRAGIPLERGLMNVGSDLPGRLGTVSRSLAESMGEGKSLSEAIVSTGRQLPPLYRVVVEAGVRSGRLTSALESLANYARNYAEMRRALGLALLYPLIVSMLAYGLFLGFATQIAPRFVVAYTSLQLPVQHLLVALAWLGERAVYWGPVIPGFVLILACAWYWSGRAGAFPARRTGALFALIPWMGGMLANVRAASFADLLGLLVAHEVPLADAVELAAESTGDSKMIQGSATVAAGIRRGDSVEALTREAPGIPPMLRWLIATGYRQGSLVPALNHAAASYRRRATNQASLIRAMLPSVLLLVVGATGTIFFTVTIIYPFTRLLSQLAVS
jgi:general secretion pathway protein F